MAGEQSCIWASWFKAHHQDYKKEGSDFDVAKWNIEHTRLLIQTRTDLVARQFDLRVEGQNAFQYRHASGAILAGRPDIVAIDGMDLWIVDCKTGKPRTSDRIQVQLYMYVFPICFPRFNLFTIRGRVIYSNSEVEIEPSAADARFGNHLDYFMNLIAGGNEPFKAASQSECRFCDIAAIHCPCRVLRPE
jgi:hypothetical protein